MNLNRSLVSIAYLFGAFYYINTFKGYGGTFPTPNLPNHNSSSLIYLIMVADINQNNFLFGDEHFHGYPITDIDRHRMQGR